jgi:hypothetical protein
MKLIFLDFDGVLVNGESIGRGSGHRSMADPSCVAALNRLIEETRAVIVVSSMWRVGESVIQLEQKLLEWGVIGEVLDKTPVMWDTIRGDEIKAWLQDYEYQYPGHIEGIVIIDDDSDMGDMSEYLVKTTFWEGLTAEHVEQAKKVLEQSISIRPKVKI